LTRVDCDCDIFDAVFLVALLFFGAFAFAFFLGGMTVLYQDAVKFFIELVRVGARK
jgi:hypothetical protein